MFGGADLRGGRFNFGVMLCSQHFYNKFYAKSCLLVVKK